MTQYFTAVQERLYTNTVPIFLKPQRLFSPAQEPTTNTAIQLRRYHRRYCHYGGRGIRTPGAVNPAVFKTAAIVHSAIPPTTVYHTSIRFGKGIRNFSLKSVRYKHIFSCLYE